MLHHSPVTRDAARTLRRNATSAEHVLWRALRGRGLAGCKFRRQHPIGNYVADFACLTRKLVVEIDGGQHALAQRRDNVRAARLRQAGYRVVRFWNNEILENLPGVLEALRRELEAAAPHPLASLAPSPQRGEGLRDGAVASPRPVAPKGTPLMRAGAGAPGRGEEQGEGTGVATRGHKR